MDNPETLATLDTRTKGRRQTKQSHTAQHKKLKDQQHGPTPW